MRSASDCPSRQSRICTRRVIASSCTACSGDSTRRVSHGLSLQSSKTLTVWSQLWVQVRSLCSIVMAASLLLAASVAILPVACLQLAWSWSWRKCCPHTCSCNRVSLSRPRCLACWCFDRTAVCTGSYRWSSGTDLAYLMHSLLRDLLQCYCISASSATRWAYSRRSQRAYYSFPLRLSFVYALPLMIC